MRSVFYSLLFLVFFLAASPSYADEFGERFYNQTPRGMAEYTVEDSIPNIAMDDIASDLQNIMPASGDEAIEEPVSVKSSGDEDGASKD